VRHDEEQIVQRRLNERAVKVLRPIKERDYIPLHCFPPPLPLSSTHRLPNHHMTINMRFYATVTSIGIGNLFSSSTYSPCPAPASSRP
jgi:hypothetical protein